MKGQGSCVWLTRSGGQLSCTVGSAAGDCILEVCKRMSCSAAACRGSYPEVYIHSLAKMCLQLLPLLLSLPAKEIRLFIVAAFQIKSGWFKLAALKLLLDTYQSLLCPPRTAGTAECWAGYTTARNEEKEKSSGMCYISKPTSGSNGC